MIERTKNKKLLKADLHVHTKYSKFDSNTELEDIIAHCQRTGINCIAVADHGTVEGALKLKEMAPFKVIVAEEVLTPHGEIMGMFLKETVPSHQPVEDVLTQIKAQGGLVCIPHPFDIFRPSGLRPEVIEHIADQIDIIEAYNSKAIHPLAIPRARRYADKHGLAKGAGSDAHVCQQIGRAYVSMPEFDGPADFLEALTRGTIHGCRTLPIKSVLKRLTRILGS